MLRAPCYTQRPYPVTLAALLASSGPSLVAFRGSDGGGVCGRLPRVHCTSATCNRPGVVHDVACALAAFLGCYGHSAVDLWVYRLLFPAFLRLHVLLLLQNLQEMQAAIAGGRGWQVPEAKRDGTFLHWPAGRRCHGNSRARATARATSVCRKQHEGYGAANRQLLLRCCQRTSTTASWHIDIPWHWCPTSKGGSRCLATTPWWHHRNQSATTSSNRKSTATIINSDGWHTTRIPGARHAPRGYSAQPCRWTT
mmetsp:Transcript_52324/g.103841  ORF Transcript_52324/g.103841 Transcript_52324/m.103841 type:complete len:253 (+) Transcript_52324:269-1027(+)